MEPFSFILVTFRFDFHAVKFAESWKIFSVLYPWDVDPKPAVYFESKQFEWFEASSNCVRHVCDTTSTGEENESEREKGSWRHVAVCSCHNAWEARRMWKVKNLVDSDVFNINTHIYLVYIGSEPLKLFNFFTSTLCLSISPVIPIALFSFGKRSRAIRNSF